MDVRGARANVARMVGNTALVTGLLAAGFGPALLGGLLVVIGVGLRLEAAIHETR
ncbi:hypothetical protein [Actinoplanes utahensis]|uniref:hypothetical protein n=1 Tax=Actinoplanes utahensis TaxID=1869 RepID=UPI001378EAEF|nr:hypothetical protein [Actinoplanes utahensis]GIF30451.1 hypothetical protein Aut01nite_34370 [Actinoplanes utahensis]